MNLDKFKKWLINHGCEILPPSNQYEALRFKGREVGIIYTTGKANGIYAIGAKQAFEANRKWYGGAIKTGRYPDYRKQKEQLILRDGTCCFYCGEEMEDDITVEHLLDLKYGGKNEISNMVLAHQKCNLEVKELNIAEKVKLAIKNRVWQEQSK